MRVHHFAPQLASPFPLLAAIGARTKRIEIGTAVIDMRYENPLYMAEDAASADLISGGRLQLGISRGSPEPALRGYESFGHVPEERTTDADLARFGKSYVGEPDAIVEELVKDAAVRDADNVLLTVPNQLGVDYNAHLLETIVNHVAPAIGWKPKPEPK